MKIKLLVIACMLCLSITTNAQSVAPSNSINGAYHLFTPEKGQGGKTKNMIVELMENNGTKMLGVAACKRCFPAVYTYKAEISKEFGKPVFHNSSGFYVATYDADSFVIFMPMVNGNSYFRYVNFYSKTQAKVQAMNKSSIEKYAMTLLEIL